jgi:hypothetical protein
MLYFVIAGMIKLGSLNQIFVKTSVSKTLKVLREELALIHEVNVYTLDKTDETKYVVSVLSDSEEVKFTIDFNQKQIYMLEI